MIEQMYGALKKHLIEYCLVGVCVVVFILSVVLFLQSSHAQPTVIQPEKAASSSPSPSEELVVDIEGAVVHPGIYSFFEHTRLQNAIEKAGGFNSQADKEYIMRNLNLAQVVTDQMKIYIPSRGETLDGYSQQPVPSAMPSTQDTTSKISINHAFQDELMELSGVGQVTAQKIMNLRPYSSLDELVSKKAVSQTLFSKIKDVITL